MTISTPLASPLDPSTTSREDTRLVHTGAVTIYRGSEPPVRITATYELAGLPEDVAAAITGSVSNMRTKIYLPGD
jgi:hypothetical protein